MSKRNPITTANDNMPAQQASVVSRVFGRSHNSQLSSLPYHHQAPKHVIKASSPQSLEPKYNPPASTNRSLILTLILWSAALIIGFLSFTLGLNTETKSLSALAVLWTGLWTSYVAADHNRWRLSEIAIVSALGGLISVILISVNYLGLSLTLTDGIILTSFLSALLGYVLKSRISVLTSICSSLLWAAMSLSGLIPVNNMIVLFPVLIALQIYVASRIHSGLAIGLAIITAYYGIIGTLTSAWAAESISTSFATALLFIIGMAHHRAGKASEDSKTSGSNIHIYAGWIIAIISAFIFQNLWLSPEAALGNDIIITPLVSMLWKVAVILSILTIFVSGIIRFKYTQITLHGIFLLTLSSALIPLMIWFPSLPDAVASQIPGMSPVPAFGLIIGAGIIAASLGFAINGVRRKSRIMLALGLAALGLEAILLINPALMSLDNVIIFFAALLASLAVSAAIAGNSLTNQAPAPRLKHA